MWNRVRLFCDLPVLIDLLDIAFEVLAKSANNTIRAALCQIYDSIFLDVPMSRVKFNVNTEYAYIQNFKILQSTAYLIG